MASPRINKAKYIIVSHVACNYICIKTQQLLFIALLFMPRLSEHERSGGIGMLNDVVNNHNCHPSFIQHLRDRYQATGTVKDPRRSGQLRMATCVKRQLTSIAYRQYLHQFWPATVSSRPIVGLQV